MNSEPIAWFVVGDEFDRTVNDKRKFEANRIIVKIKENDFFIVSPDFVLFIDIFKWLDTSPRFITLFRRGALKNPLVNTSYAERENSPYTLRTEKESYHARIVGLSKKEKPQTPKRQHDSCSSQRAPRYSALSS